MGGIVIPTVPHTGTMFAVRLFTDLGYNQIGLNDPQNREKVVRSGHIVRDGQYQAAVRHIKGGDPAVVPLRHPYLVAESWKRRDKPIDDMKIAYRRLPELQALGAYFLPMDIDGRESYLEVLKAGTGLPVTTKWPVINSYHSTAGLRYTDVTPDADMLAFSAEMGGFLEQFY